MCSQELSILNISDDRFYLHFYSNRSSNACLDGDALLWRFLIIFQKKGPCFHGVQSWILTGRQRGISCKIPTCPDSL